MHLSTGKAKKVRKSFLGGGEKDFMEKRNYLLTAGVKKTIMFM